MVRPSDPIGPGIGFSDLGDLFQRENHELFESTVFMLIDHSTKKRKKGIYYCAHLNSICMILNEQQKKRRK